MIYFAIALVVISTAAFVAFKTSKKRTFPTRGHGQTYASPSAPVRISSPSYNERRSADTPTFAYYDSGSSYSSSSSDSGSSCSSSDGGGGGGGCD